MAMPPGERRYYPKHFYVFVYRTKRGRLVAAISGDPTWRVGEINVGRGGGAELKESDLPVKLVARGAKSTTIKIARTEADLLNKGSVSALKDWSSKNALVAKKETQKLST